eukprot:6834689-Pyramimonas_sp.AAC.1
MDSPWTTLNCLDFEVSISWKYSMLEQMCSLAPLSTMNNGVAQLRFVVEVAAGAKVDVSPASDALITMVVDFIRSITTKART